MVSSTRTASRLMIIARPNQSATWRCNLLLLMALSIPLLALATLFTLRGAWPILPLMGLELLALGAALYYVNRKLQYRQVITLSDDSVCIEKGFHRPRQSWLFPRAATGLTITAETHPWDGPALSLHDRNNSVSLGEFLGRDESLQLLALLEKEIRVRARSSAASCSF